MNRLNSITIYKIGLVIILSLYLIFIPKANVEAITSEQISFQGKIVRNDSGYEGMNVVDGSPTCVQSGGDSCDFKVYYYTASTGGTLLLSEEFSNVEIGDFGGVFDLTLGAGITTTTAQCIDGTCNSALEVVSEYDDVYLELQFAPDGSSYTETFNRVSLRATGYSLASKYANENKGGFTFNPQSATPTSVSEGTVYYDSDTDRLNVYSNDSWRTLSTGFSSIWSSSSLGSWTWANYMTDATPGISTLSAFTGDVTEERVSINGDGSKSGFSVYSDYNNGTDWPLASFKSDGSSFTGTVLSLINEGLGNYISGYGASGVLEFEFDNDGGLHLANDGVSYYEAWGTAPTVSNLNPNTGEGCMYAYGGDIYWDASCDGTAEEQLNGGSASSLWTDAGTFEYLTDTSDDVILGASTVADATFLFDVDGSGGSYFEVDNAGNTETLFAIDDDGNVGIGTASPTAKLDIAGSSSTITNSSGELTIDSYGFTHFTTDVIFDSAVDIQSEIENGGSNFNGRVYIPDSVEITSNLYMTDYMYHRSDIDTYMGFSSNDNIVMRTNGSDRFTINSSGNGTFSQDISIQGGNITIGPENGVNEGGQISMWPAGSNDAWYMDVYNNDFRIYSTSADSEQVSIFGTLSAMDLYIDGNLRLNGAFYDDDTSYVTFGEDMGVNGNETINGYMYVDTSPGSGSFDFYDNSNTYGRMNFGNISTWWGTDNIWMNLGGTGDQRLYIRYGSTVVHQFDADGDVRHMRNVDINGDLSVAGSLYMSSDTVEDAPLADTFANNTYKNYIHFLAGSNGTGSSNDPGMIIHESSSTETNEGVLHLMPSDDNAMGDYVSIHGTNDADVIKLHTSGRVEGVTDFHLSTSISDDDDGDVNIGESLYVSGNHTTYNDLYGRSVNGQYSNMYRIGGLFFTWDSDSYGTDTYHSIRSANGTTAAAGITVNSFGNIRLNIDSNGNTTDVFEIGHNTTHTSNTIFRIDETGIMTSWVGTGSGSVGFSTPSTFPGIVLFANNGRRADIRRTESALAFYTHASSGIPSVGRLVINNTGQTAVSMPHYGGSAQTDWPVGWWGGISTWDMLAAGVRYSSLSNRSDIKLKKDIEYLENTDVLEKLMDVDPISYTWIDPRASQEINYGVVAQEVQEVFPEIVEASTEESGGLLSVRYTDFLSMLVLGHQDQELRLRDLDSEIEQLEQNLNSGVSNLNVLGVLTSDFGLDVKRRIGASDIEISQNSVNSLIEPLSIQSQLGGNINFFDGGIQIDPNGAVVSRGSIEVRSVELSGESLSNGTIKAGERSVIIHNELISTDSKVLISARSKTFGNSLYISEVNDSEYFVVSIQNPCEEDISFSWIVVGNLDNIDN